MKLRELGAVRGMDGVDGRFLGLGVSSVGIGLAVIEDGLARVGALHPADPSLTGAARLCWLRDRLVEVLEGVRPDMVAAEDYVVGAPGAVGEVGAVVRMVLHEAALPYRLVRSGDLRLFVCGRVIRGGIPADEVLHRFGVRVDTASEAEDVTLAVVAASLARPDAIILSAHQKQTLERLED